MKRRQFLAACAMIAGALIPSITHAATHKKFLFKIKTKSKSIIGNILIEAKDLFGAISKLNKRYPGCEILEAKEK